jgi:Clostripain family
MPEMKEWTLMFYFASDNSLASAIVSQLKAIMAAGFHKEANVIAYFDPQPKNTPSHVFDVNMVEKLKRPDTARHSFGANDPFVRNLMFDRLWAKKDKATKESLRQYLKNEHVKYESKTVPDTLTGEQAPLVSFHEFLTFCRTKYQARHYMLFILGHGVVVGNDIFLLDENIPDDDEPAPANDNTRQPGDPPLARQPVRNSLKLQDLGNELKEFTNKIRKKGGELELLGLHSCSMSGLEVAYEIQGAANYLLASQGPAFVGSWPYKQILTRVFNDLADPGEDNSKPKLKNRLTKIFSYCVKNSYDFQLAGYSFDLTLCDLSKLKDGVTVPLKELSKALIAGLNEKDESVRERLKEIILLAHWDAQSFWQEQYTDLYDFCFRLNRRSAGYAEAPPALKKINVACENIMKVLKRGKQGDDNGLIVRSEFIGPLFQYSHGLSVFFPWSEPVDKKFLGRYAKYKFTTEFTAGGGDSWLNFLNAYFVETRRDLHRDEGDELDKPAGPAPMTNLLLSALQKISNSISGAGEQLVKGPGDPTGDACECPSIKNYPSSTDAPRGGDFIPVYEAPLSPNIAEQFETQSSE